MTHGRAEQGQAIVAAIEQGHARRNDLPPVTLPSFKLRPRHFTPLAEVWDAIVNSHRRRTLVGLSLMVSQAFFYNAIFFTYALVLTEFYGIPSDRVGLYILPFAIGNFLGPLLIGRLFDSWGRRPMIALTYALSGVLLAVTGYLFAQGLLSATGQTIAWSVIFFFASAAASSAYLTVSETFPLEIRALAIAFFYAVGTGIGGVVAPAVFGVLIETGSRVNVAAGYLLGAVLMLAAAVVAALYCVPAERKPLEVVAPPLSGVDESIGA
jgi:MFS family permease